MSDWVKSRTPQLIAQIGQFVAALNNDDGRTASGLSEDELDDLEALKDDLQANYTAQIAAEAAYRAAVDETQAKQAEAVGMFRALARAANSNPAMSDNYRNEAGLTIRDTEPTPGALPLVEDLTVVGRPNGNNFLDWGTPAGVAAGIVWEIESSPGAGGPWTLVGASSRTDFLHEGAGAGVHRLYRVTATRGQRRGEPGNEAAVYG